MILVPELEWRNYKVEMLEHMREIVACIEEKLMCKVGWLEQTEANQAGAMVKFGQAICLF